MSNITIKDIGRYINLTPIEVIMRDDKPEMINETNFNIIVNLHPTDGTHWVLVIRRGVVKFTPLTVLVLRLHHYS